MGPGGGFKCQNVLRSVWADRRDPQAWPFSMWGACPQLTAQTQRLSFQPCSCPWWALRRGWAKSYSQAVFTY